MEKTYRFTLPQNKEASIANFRVERGEVIIYVKLEYKLHPKDGDFLADKDGCVFICSRPFSDCYGCYAGSYCDGTIHAESEVTWVKKAGCRYATPEEKSDFLARLEKECHKRWNPETKQLEDIRWRAKMRERYYFVTSACDVASYEESNLGCDNVYYNLGNYYRNVEAAQKVAEQIKDIFKNSKAE